MVYIKKFYKLIIKSTIESGQKTWTDIMHQRKCVNDQQIHKKMLNSVSVQGHAN